jgi:hypothetical protein
MKPDQIAKSPHFTAGDRRFAPIDAALGFECHSSASLRRRNVLLTYFPFRRTSTRHEPDLSLVKVAMACALRVQ